MKNEPLSSDPAFPIVLPMPDGRLNWENGLTKRELVAAMLMQGAMQGLGAAAIARALDEEFPVDHRAIAIDAVKAADALFEELSK